MQKYYTTLCSQALLKNARQSKRSETTVAELSPQPEDLGLEPKGLLNGFTTTPARQIYLQAYAQGKAACADSLCFCIFVCCIFGVIRLASRLMVQMNQLVPFLPFLKILVVFQCCSHERNQIYLRAYAQG